MRKMRTAVVGLVVITLWPFVWGEISDVWCHWNANCVLAASFPIGEDVVIHWIQELPGPVQFQVHSFYYGTDQLANQDKRFRGRTAVFKKNIAGGNASLLLRDVVVGDEGRYKCYIGTLLDTRESFINLHVIAPVWDVHMELSDEAVFCRARSVYPAPTLLWSTDPPIDVEPFNNTKKQQTDLGFYDIESWLTLKVARSINVDFICDITNDRNNKRAQLRIQDAIHAASNSEMKVPCSFPAKLDTFELTWRTRHSEHILSMGVSGLKRQLTISAEWKHHVLDGRSAWRHLKLPNVLPDHQGTYTCQVRTPQVTYITQTDVIVTSDTTFLQLLCTVTVFSFLLLVSLCIIGFLGFKLRSLLALRFQKTREDDSTAVKEEINSINNNKDEGESHSNTKRQNLNWLSFSVIRQRFSNFLSTGRVNSTVT